MEKIEKSSHTTKIRKKKQAKNVVTEREGFGWGVPIERLGSSHVPYIIINKHN